MSVKSYYERYWSERGFKPVGRLTRPLRELYEATIGPDDEVLDVGCGDGGTSGPWISEHAARYVGVDVSSAGVEDARAAGLEAHVIEDAASLPFDDDSFSAVVCVEVLEHLFEPQVAAREMARVLRPGGVLIATVPNVAYWRRRLDFVALGRWNPLGDDRSVQEPWRDPHIRFFNVGSLRRMLAGAGFDPVEVAEHGPAVPGDIPVARKAIRRRGGWAVPDWTPNPLYAQLERRAPGLLGYRLHAVARLP